MRTTITRLLVCLLMAAFAATAGAASYTYKRLGNPQEAHTRPSSGTAMMGGGADLDEAFRWLCEKGDGGDVLVLRARGDDAYNPYIKSLCKTNSVATLVIPDRAAALDPAVAATIQQAAVVFIAGGDQANYVRGWQGTPVAAAINAHIAAGKPVGGTSAGLAVLGEFAYGALNDKPDDADLASTEVLPDPYFYRVTLVRRLLRIPHLENLLTDSHFAQRDRMGRTLGFLARLMQDGWSAAPREVAIDASSAVLVQGDGRATVVGKGKGAYFLKPTRSPELCRPGAPLTFHEVSVQHVPAGGQFDLVSWKSTGGVDYSLSVDKGRITSTQAGGSVY
ncbi:MAG: cyanophycinase [Gammaproteobacteria bacterium]|nr:cyanophycinase [Gammaproteobacteria bacterium]